MSRELDARVAECLGNKAACVYCGCRRDWHEKQVSCMNFRPSPYSTDPAACEELRKECRRRGWCYEEAWYAAADGSDAEFWTWVNDFDLHHISEVSQEEAFCLAFLAAVEAEKGAKQQ